MKKTTKLLSLFITLAMMLTMALPLTASAAFSDVPSNHHYYNAIHNLSAEGILNGFEDGSFKPSEPVTRAQFTKIICYALSVGNLTYSEAEKSIFTDVQPEHWAADNIVTAYKQGIINGMGDGTFAPEAGVNYEQAVKMAVCAIGYSPERAESLGGYPGGYMSLANSAKLLTDINDAKMGQVMTRGAVAQLIDNMMDAEQISDGQPGGSLREEVSTSKKVDGQVVAGYGVALYNDLELNACRKNEILVSLGHLNIPYDISEINGFDIYEYLGRSVTIYYEEESGATVGVASSIALQPRKNETTKIDLDMIYDYDASSIEYYTNEERTETETIDYQTIADVLWNGQPTSDDVQTLLTSHGAKAGYITLVSSQANQSADVVFLKTYDTIVVQSVDTKTDKVFAKNVGSLPVEYASGIVLDVTDRTKKVTIKSGSSNFALSSIRENHILSISRSASGAPVDVIEVLVSSKSVSGTIEFMTNSPETQVKLNTGNAIYTVSPSVWANPGTAPMTTGMFVQLYIDAFGKVARYVPAAEATYNYGYIASLEEMGTSSNPEIWVMIYKPQASNSTLTGQILKFADKVKIDGTGYTVSKDVNGVKTALSNAAARVANTGFATEVDPIGTVTYSQPVRFALDKSNQISGIITNATTGDPATSLNIVNKVGTDGIECKVDATTFDQYKISSSTPILYVPQNRESGTYQSKTNNFFNEGDKYYVQFANVSGTNVVSCVYVYGVVGSGAGSSAEVITEENKPLIVTAANAQKLHMGTETSYIKVMDVTTGAEFECFEETVDLSALAVGDVIRVAIGADQYVEALEVLADASGVAAGTFNYGTDVYEKIDGSGTGINAEFRVLLSTVKSKDGNTFVVVPGYNAAADASLGETYTVSGDVPVYRIDTAAVNDTNIVNSSSAGEILGSASQHSKVMVYTVEGAIQAVIIFE